MGDTISVDHVKAPTLRISADSKGSILVVIIGTYMYAAGVDAYQLLRDSMCENTLTSPEEYPPRDVFRTEGKDSISPIDHPGGFYSPKCEREGDNPH